MFLSDNNAFLIRQLTISSFMLFKDDELMYMDTAAECRLYCCAGYHGAPNYAVTIDLISIVGKVQATLITCSSCNRLDALLRQGYFPLTELNQDCVTFFSVSLLSLIDSMCLKGQLPVHRAVGVLFNGAAFGQGRWTPELATSIYQRIQRHGVLLRFRQMLMDHSHWPESCLLCPGHESNRSTVLCADALFGWQRLSKLGANQRSTPDDTHTLPAPLVHVQTGMHDTTPGDTESCPNWRAGALIPKVSARGAARLDVHGFFGLFCRHNRIVAGSNITTPGERLCYARQNMLQYLRTTQTSSSLLFVYDIGECFFIIVFMVYILQPLKYCINHRMLLLCKKAS